MRVKDPVCGKRFYLDEAATQHEHDGWLYFFCSGRCLRLFEMLPEQFTDKPALDILNERFARGEIDKEEYEERKRLLSS